MKEKNETFSISQVSQMTGVSKNRIREWHDKGLLPLVKYGKSS
jgi:DNA-binding transcriptional MerR regulator